MKSKKKRTNIPKYREAAILFNSRRRCALCFSYEQDKDIKRGQIAHIDRNPENNKESNLAFLCLTHHDEYDGKTSQSKRWTPQELADSKKKLTEFITNDFDNLLPDLEISNSVKRPIAKKGKRQIITPEVYNLRIPIYNSYRNFVTKILRDAKIDYSDLFDFASKTHEALFLYDENIADFLSVIFQKGGRFQYLNKLIANPNLVKKENWNSIVEEESDLLQWFHDNLEEARSLFKQYLNL